MSEEPIVTDTEFSEPPAKVWRAMTEPDLLARWLPEAAEQAEIVDADPGQRLHLLWRDRDEAGGLIESDVVFTLIPTIDGGTRLRVVHDAFVHMPAMTVALAQRPGALRRRRAATLLGGLAWAA